VAAAPGTMVDSYRSPEKFSRSDECGRTIALERLDAIPYAPRYVHCKQDWGAVRTGRQ